MNLDLQEIQRQERFRREEARFRLVAATLAVVVGWILSQVFKQLF